MGSEVTLNQVDVALPLPVFSTFTYTVNGPVPPTGTRVLVPFRREERIGWVVGACSRKDLPRVRPVLDVLEDDGPVDLESVDLDGPE